MRSHRVYVTLLLAMMANVSPGLAQKLDTVIVENNDRVTGEIKKMERGRLEYKTDDMGTLSIKWNKVRRLWSPFFFEIEVTDGRKFFGSLSDPGRDSVVIVSLFREDTLDVLDVVTITPIKRTFWSRLNGFVDVGLSFAKANKALTLSSNVEVQYRGEKAAFGIDYNTYVQTQTTAAQTTRNGLTFTGDYFFKTRWALAGSYGLQQNTELGLDLRRSITATMNRSIVHTNKVDLQGGLGLTRTNEDFTASDTNTTNVEGVITARFDWFRYDAPKLDIVTALDLYPSLTTKGRIRSEFSFRSTYELFTDFTVGLQFRASLDSKQPDTGLGTTDYTVSFTVGWKFNR